MKISRAIFLMVISMGTGILAGVIIAYGIGVFTTRSGGSFGGEVLIVPLMILLVYMGYQIRQFIESVLNK